jgi:hypothetical protein
VVSVDSKSWDRLTHLLSVGGRALEIDTDRAAVDQNITRDDTDVLATSEDIEQGSLRVLDATCQHRNQLTLPAPEAPMRAVRVPGLT